MITFSELKKAGFIFDGATKWISKSSAEDALVTNPNTTFPVLATSFIAPEIIDILTAPRNARLLGEEVKRGDWTTTYFDFPVREFTGGSTAYTDYGNGITSGVNYNFVPRKQYVFQTVITYGDREVDVANAARINLIADKQIAAAETLERDLNKYQLFGVPNTDITGIFNDPGLNPSTSVSSWTSATTDTIYNDILTNLFNPLVTSSLGYVTATSDLKLAVSAAASVILGKKNQYGLSVLEMLKGYMPNLNVVVIPELANMAGGDTMFLIADNIFGRTIELPYGEKMRACRIILDETSYRQKFVSSTYGAIVKYPMLISSIVGF